MIKGFQLSEFFEYLKSVLIVVARYMIILFYMPNTINTRFIENRYK